MFKCALFDLDGTLINTIDDLANACNMLIKKYSYEADWSLDDYMRFVGNGAKLLVSRAFGDSLDDETLQKRFEEFKAVYSSIKLENAYAYDGIKNQLDMLKQKGIKLCVVTNKPNEAAQDMLNHIFGEDYFDFVIGCCDGVPTKPDPSTTFMALNAVGCSSGEAVYFGDSEVDVRTAKNADVFCVGCSWGFRSFEAIFRESPDVIIDKPEYISSIVL